MTPQQTNTFKYDITIGNLFYTFPALLMCSLGCFLSDMIHHANTCILMALFVMCAAMFIAFVEGWCHARTRKECDPMYILPGEYSLKAASVCQVMCYVVAVLSVVLMVIM